MCRSRPRPHPTACRPCRLRSGPFIDSETGRLEEARARRCDRPASTSPMATPSHGAGGWHAAARATPTRSRSSGPLRIGIPLFNIFLNEADELSRRLATELAEWALELHRPVGESTVAHAHSLAGNSRHGGFTDLSQPGARARACAGARQRARPRHGRRGAAVHRGRRRDPAPAAPVRRRLPEGARPRSAALPDPSTSTWSCRHRAEPAEPSGVADMQARLGASRRSRRSAPASPSSAGTELRTLGRPGHAVPARAAEVDARAVSRARRCARRRRRHRRRRRDRRRAVPDLRGRRRRN